MKKFVGAHVSAAGGVENAPLNAKKIGAKAFALFTKNQRQWNSKPLTKESIQKFKDNLKIAHILPEHVLPHDSYLINLGNSNEEKRGKSLDSFIEEINRVNQLGLKYLNFHPGSHLKELTEEECMGLISDAMNYSITNTKNITLVIETTAGQGTNIGYNFGHIAYIIDKITDKSRVGVCIDTCHIFSAGYNIATPELFNKVMNEFDKIVGIKYLKGLHINDSKIELGKRVDRHHNLGQGYLGWEPFKFIMNDDRFSNMPLILETTDDTLWADEIKKLYEF